MYTKNMRKEEKKGWKESIRCARKEKKRDNYTYSKFNLCIYVFVNLLFIIDKRRDEEKRKISFFSSFCMLFLFDLLIHAKKKTHTRHILVDIIIRLVRR